MCRSNLLKLLTLWLTICHFPSHAGVDLAPTQSDFLNYTNYATPEFFDDNPQALYARLKMIDMVPEGGEIRIMTFNYDNGTASRHLAMHLCMAAHRHVTVKILPDSKSGDTPGDNNPFGLTPDNKVNEDVYQMLANCGVQVRIYNHIPHHGLMYVGTQAVPAPPARINSYVLDRLSDYKPDWLSLGFVGQFIDGVLLLKDFYEVQENFFATHPNLIDQNNLDTIKAGLWGLLGTGIEALYNAKTVEDRMAILEAALQDKKIQKSMEVMKTDLNSGKVKSILTQLMVEVLKHPRLGEFYRQARMLNRLNHRKLLVASSEGQSCMIIGGRNLGDDYLQWTAVGGSEFMDGDVLICSQHNKDVIDQANASFDELWNNTDVADPYDLPPLQTVVRRDTSFKYKYLRFPDFHDARWGNPMHFVVPVDAEGGLLIPDYSIARLTYYKEPGEVYKPVEQSLPAPMYWQDTARIEGTHIEQSSNWRIATASWMRERDKVRAELNAAIKRETQTIYIETAYSEMSRDLRNLLEGALQRGVAVHIVTNSIFVLDANSKVIRLLMARWSRQMETEYPNLFKIEYTTVAYGHMIHFKGASFQCQVDGNKVYRLNMVGSHNFHDRSGYSDKEHAILWEQPPKESCATKVGGPIAISTVKDLMDFRNEFYASKQNPVALKAYFSLKDELEDSMKSGKLTEKQKKHAQLMLKIIFESTVDAGGNVIVKMDATGRPMVREQIQVFQFLEALSTSGLADIVGSLF